MAARRVKKLHRPVRRANSIADAAYPNLWKGLVGAWSPTLSPRGGTILRDLSGRGNHGTLTSMDPPNDWVTSGRYKGLDFDNGAIQYVLLDKQPSITTEKGTLVVWLKNAQASGGNGCWVFNNTTFDNHYCWTDGGWYDGTFISVRQLITPSATIDRTSLHRVSLTFSGGTLQAWQNNLLVDTKAGLTWNWTAGANTRIGGSSGTYWYYGIIYDLRLYDRCFSSQDHCLDYELGPGGWAARRKSRLIIADSTGAVATPWFYTRRHSIFIGGGLN